MLSTPVQEIAPSASSGDVESSGDAGAEQVVLKTAVEVPTANVEVEVAGGDDGPGVVTSEA